MEEILNRNDIQQQYYGCVVLYKGQPVKVTAVAEAEPGKVSITFLRTQKRQTVPFSLKDFTAPAVRLGMVNTEAGAFFMSRYPVRRMQVGISQNNVQIKELPTDYLPDANRCLKALHNMTAVEIADTIDNSYPDFRTSVEYVREFKSNIAFDRQFAIDHKFRIFYKNRCVGHLPKNCRTVERIQFSEGNEYLNQVVGDKYENAFAGVCP